MGSLTIQDGVIVRSRYGCLGYRSGSTGTATVNGPNSKWTNDDTLWVGYHGTGTLIVTNSGTVTSGFGSVGSYSDSTGMATVDGLGSTWMNVNDLSVGDSGIGVLSIVNGGIVSNSYGFIGNSSGSTGTVTISGAGLELDQHGQPLRRLSRHGRRHPNRRNQLRCRCPLFRLLFQRQRHLQPQRRHAHRQVARKGQRNGRVQFRRRNPSGQRDVFFQLAHDLDRNRRQRECRYQRSRRYAFRRSLRHGRIDQIRRRHIDPLRRKRLQRSDHRHGRRRSNWDRRRRTPCSTSAAPTSRRERWSSTTMAAPARRRRSRAC